MKAERLQQIEELFHAALECEPEARRKFLGDVCADDGELRAEVEALLLASAQAPEFIVASAPVIASGSHADPKTGEHINQYRLLREIGRGGMGAVWLAERDDGRFHQRVAIKVIKRGMDTDEVSHRFAQERQILAQLNHPQIARLLDGGETADGRLWFALEYVEGERFDRYCVNRKLGLVERLELFREVCAAVQYAHQNLVIHRDLKPANILVTAEGAPKLLDFGIAKLFDPGHETAGVTETGQRVMTLDYASPEQVRGQRVATASDVYSLGVILYEMLAGRMPHELSNRPLHEITRIICEEEPRKPSHGDSHNTAGPWRGRLADDLDNIVLKALRKEPERRYHSAAELAEDIRRYLAGLPVSASRDTFAYRAVKFARRNKAFVMAAALVMLSVLTGIILTVWQAQVARAQERIAKQERDKARRINEFLRDTLFYAEPTYNRPGHGKGADAKLVDAIRYAEKQIDEKFKDQPEIRCDLHNTLGQIWLQRGEYQSAEIHIRDAMELARQIYGEHHTRVSQNLFKLGIIEGRKGNIQGGITMIRQAVEMMRLSDPQNGALPWMLLELGQMVMWEGKIGEAESLIIEAREGFSKMATPEAEYQVAYTFCRLGNLYKEKGELERAQATYLGYLERLRRLPVKHEAGEALYNLGVIDYTNGNYQEAEKRLNEAERLFSQYLGQNFGQIADFLYYLASIHCLQGDYAKAEAEARRALEISRQMYGPDHPRIIRSLGLLIKALISAGKSARAAPYLREAMEKFRDLPNEKKWIQAGSILGECLTLLKRYDEAERLMTGTCAIHQCNCSEKTSDDMEMRQRLVKLYEAWRKPEQAALYRF